MTKQKKRARKPLTVQQKREREEKRLITAYKKRIRATFVDSGFTYFRSENKHFNIGTRVVELDYIFVYENIILICEDTCGKSHQTDHIRKKNEAFQEIKANVSDFLNWLTETFFESKHMFEKYRAERYLVYYIYAPQHELDLTDEQRKRYGNLIFAEPQTMSYFYKMSQSIHYSARYEIFRFLNISNEQIGSSSSESTKTTIKAPIIYPQDITGLRNGIRVVSFMMSAEKLLKTCYVLRKDNWEESMFLYQRLIEKEKIRSIRTFLANKGEAFYNNIIVALPDNVSFEDDAGNAVGKDKIKDFQHCKLVMPDEMNSICVIDGQHRIYAHYEGPSNDRYEGTISGLRKELHLLVTGLLFPSNMPDIVRKQIQSEIFLDINDNTKKVAANVLTHIAMIKDPFSDIGIARRVVERLNKKAVFLNRFELSALDESKIKVSSIIKYALRYLVTLTPAEGKTSLYSYWNGNRVGLSQKNETDLEAYIEYCAQQLNMYFSAVKEAYIDAWRDDRSKIFSIASINGFIIALNRQLTKNGVRDYAYYSSCFKKARIDFSNAVFPFASSQYRKFSTVILRDAFEFTEEEVNIY